MASWLLPSVSSHVCRGLIGFMIATCIRQKLHRDLSSSSTTRIMHKYERLKARKLVHQPMRDYLTEIQTTCDSLASCGYPISQMQQISIIINIVKGQFDNIIVVIHATRNPYDVALVSSVLLDAEYRQVDLLFDNFIYANVVVVNRSSTGSDTQSNNTFMTSNYLPSQSQSNNYSMSNTHPSDGLLHTPPVNQQYQQQSSGFNAGICRGRSCGYGNNKFYCQLCDKFGHLVHRCYH